MTCIPRSTSITHSTRRPDKRNARHKFHPEQYIPAMQQKNERTGPEHRADAFWGSSVLIQWPPVFLSRRLGRFSN
jgi:hypothetical protein